MMSAPPDPAIDDDGEKCRCCGKPLKKHSPREMRECEVDQLFKDIACTKLSPEQESNKPKPKLQDQAYQTQKKL